MKVTSSPDNPQVSNTRANSAQDLKKTNRSGASSATSKVAPEAAPTRSEDAAPEISSKARDFAKAKQVAADAPDVREERIAELKKRIASGKYNVDAGAVADRMVDDHLRSGIG